MCKNPNVENVFVKITKEEREARIKELVDKYKKEVGTEEFWKRQPVDNIDSEAINAVRSTFHHSRVIELVPYCKNNFKNFLWIWHNGGEYCEFGEEEYKEETADMPNVEIISDFECKIHSDNSYYTVGFYPGEFTFNYKEKLKVADEYLMDYLNLLNMLNRATWPKYYIDGDNIVVDVSRVVDADVLNPETIAQMIRDLTFTIEETLCGLYAVADGKGIIEGIKAAGPCETTLDRLEIWKGYSLSKLDYDPVEEYYDK